MRPRTSLLITLLVACGSGAADQNTHTVRWETRAPMPETRTEVAVEAIHVISGGPQPGFAFGAANERLLELP